jgi:hypothetical protein
MEPVTLDETRKLIENIDIKKSFGHDYIHPLLLKSAVNVVTEPLTHLFNLSLSQSVFPDNLKIAKVIPVFKGGDPSDVNNYRPISVLPILSKLLERLVNNRLVEFFEKNELFSQIQHGFRSNTNTADAITELVNEIQNSLDKSKYTAGVFLDLKKAFDTVSHEVLLKKLDFYGIRGTSKNLIASYLNNRKQFVQISNTKSKTKIIKCGVPQGSILGPTLFLIYINDIQNSIIYGKAHLFADDTCITYNNININNMNNEIQSDINNLSDWLKVNKLVINVKKSNIIYFCSKNRNDSSINSCILMNGEVIQSVNCCKYLGIILDKNLSWKEHVLSLCKKLGPILGILFKVRDLIPSHLIVQIYHALFNSNLSYCIEVWGSAYQCHINPLVILQKKSIRIISFSEYNQHTDPLFKS